VAPEQAALPQTTTTAPVVAAPAPSTTGATPQTVVAVAPQTYTLTLPQNGVVDDADVATVTEMATARGWTNEQAQAALTELNASLVSQAATFRAELDTDPEIGGTKFAAAQESALRVLDKFLPVTLPEGAAFRQALNKSGYGNYMPLMKLLSRIGKAMSEDKPMPGSPSSGVPEERISTAEALYGKTTPIRKPQ